MAEPELISCSERLCRGAGEDPESRPGEPVQRQRVLERSLCAVTSKRNRACAVCLYCCWSVGPEFGSGTERRSAEEIYILKFIPGG